LFADGDVCLLGGDRVKVFLCVELLVCSIVYCVLYVLLCIVCCMFYSVYCVYESVGLASRFSFAQVEFDMVIEFFWRGRLLRGASE
jgi:hypothetical protein